MIRKPHLIALVIAALPGGLAAPAQAQSLRDDIADVVHDYLASHPDEVAVIVKDYMVQHPDMLRDVFSAMLRKGAASAAAPPAPAAPDPAVAIRANDPLLLNSSHQVVLGNPQGDVTLVEFFDYNCGFCKRALTDTLTLLKDDPKLRIVLKEFPILGPGSVEAARVAVALRMQDSSGSKYLAFHQSLLGQTGPANMERALAAAAAAGADMARLRADIESAEVRDTLAEAQTLAHDIGVRGTPGYVVGDTLIPGAIGAVSLKASIAAARPRPPG